MEICKGTSIASATRSSALALLPLGIVALSIPAFWGGIGIASAQTCDTFAYDHNRSTMSVRDCGNRLEIYYERPRAGLLAQGVSPGVLLFEGSVVRTGTARQISGTARVFRKGCPPATYRVEGVTATIGPNLITLEGDAPRRAQNGCKMIGSRPDTLTFSPIKPSSVNSDVALDGIPPAWTHVPGGFAGEWQILDRNGKQLGIVVLDHAGYGTGQISAGRNGAGLDAKIKPFADKGLAVELLLEPSGQHRDAKSEARLVFDRQGDTGKGSLLDMSGRMQPVTMRLVGSGQIDDQGAEPDENDLPGFGIYGSEYEITNIPQGMHLNIHEKPDAKSRVVGSVSAKERGIYVVDCTPEIDNIAFHEASRPRRAAMLRNVWCKVTNTRDETGYVPGRNLLPL